MSFSLADLLEEEKGRVGIDKDALVDVSLQYDLKADLMLGNTIKISEVALYGCIFKKAEKRYEIRLDASRATRTTLRHELCHLKYGDPDYEINSFIKNFIQEPRAELCSAGIEL